VLGADVQVGEVGVRAAREASVRRGWDWPVPDTASPKQRFL